MTEPRRRPAPAGRRAGGDAGFWLAAGGVFAASAWVTVVQGRAMGGGMPMPGGWTMSMLWMRMPGQSWPAAAAMFVAMWVPMMVAMMLPSALPMLRNFRRFRDPQGPLGRGLATAVMGAGYFTTWTGLGLAIWIAGLAWADLTMRSAAVSRAVPFLTGAALVVAGAAQFVPWKRAGLDECRDPRACCVIGRRVGARRCFAHGLHRGVSCGVCCTGPMLAMMALGAMDLRVMAGAGAWIAAEKLAPAGWATATVRLTGVSVMAAGAWVAATAR